MQRPKNPYQTLFAAGAAGLLVAVVAGGIVVALLRGPANPAALRAAPVPGPEATIDAIADGMAREDADAVLSRIDMKATFDVFYRFVLESELKRPVTDEELKPYAARNAPFIPVMTDAVRHGIVTKSDRDAATGGSLLFGLVHLKEGTLQRKDDDHASVVFADGSSLLFERRPDGWLVTGFVGIDAKKLDEYRRAAYGALGQKRAEDAAKGAAGAVKAPGTSAGTAGN